MHHYTTCLRLLALELIQEIQVENPSITFRPTMPRLGTTPPQWNIGSLEYEWNSIIFSSFLCIRQIGQVCTDGEP